MKVIIMRGLPGSGKSTWVKNNTTKNKTVVCSADHFFTKVDGSYEFNQSLLETAHKWCLSRYTEHVRVQQAEPRRIVWYDTIVVDNTNLRLEDIAPYYRLAQAYGVDTIKIIQCLAPITTCIKENIHGVPEDAIIRMESYREPLPNNWLPNVELHLR